MEKTAIYLLMVLRFINLRQTILYPGNISKDWAADKMRKTGLNWIKCLSF